MKRFVLALMLCGCNGLTQSPECARYLACVDAIMDGGSAAYPSYAPGGSCWATDKASADLCSVACADGLNTLKTMGAGRGNPGCQ